jgi:hypothetical protein
MLDRLVRGIGVEALAERRKEPALRFRARDDGSPMGTREVVVVYVSTSSGEARLVVPADELAQPTGPDALQMESLRDLLGALDLWRSGAAAQIAAEDADAAEERLGWWTETREPYSPDVVVAAGTLAPAWAPEGAPRSDWPLDQSLAEIFAAPFGGRPAEVTLSNEEAIAVWRAARETEGSFWGPLWRDIASTAPYLVGVRVAPPGSNHMLVDYIYSAPPAQLAPRPAAAASGTPAP